MRITTLSTLLLPVLAAANFYHIAAPPVDLLVAVTVKSPSATAASVPTLSTPAPTIVSTKGVESFELKPRQGGAPINPDPNGNPNVAAPVPRANPDLAIPLAAPPVPAALPLALAVPGLVRGVPRVVPRVVTSNVPTTTPISQYVTVQWVETKMGSTSRSWIPKTITIKYDISPSKAPEPGKGVIGMGTLTGETGKTKTIVVGAAPTRGIDWWGVGVAAGVAAVGAVV